MNPHALQNLIKLLIGILMSLLPLYTLLAQDKENKEEQKTMRVKLFKSVDGKFLYSKDTVINVTDHPVVLQTLKGLKVDTTTWRKLNSTQYLRSDSVSVFRYLQSPSVATFGLPVDTAVWKKLKESKVNVYRMDKSLSKEDREKLFERIKGAPGDTFLMKALKSEKIHLLNTDSAQTLHLKRYKLDASVAGKAIRIISSDSAHVKVFNSLKPAIVISGEHALQAHEVAASYTTSDSIRIETDSTGNTSVFKIDAQGNKTKIDGYHFGRSGNKATVIVVRKVKVEDITAEDKKALQEAGARVEMKPKEELEVEAIEYYPNPNNGRFNLRFTLENKGTTVVRVMDSKGEEVFVDTVEKLQGEYSREIDLTPFGPGLYFLQVAQGKKYHTKKILVK